MADNFSSRKLLALDGVRGLAILAVMAHHLCNSLMVVGPVTGFVRRMLSFGWSGVDLFFVLSGFLITGILLDTRDAKTISARSTPGASCAFFHWRTCF